MEVVIKPDCGLTGLTFKDPSLTRTEFADDCDIRVIVQRFLRTGQLPEGRQPSGITDATNLPDNFQDLQDRVVDLRQRFEVLPLEIRNKYNNDPLAWLEDSVSEHPDEAQETAPSAPSEKPVEASEKPVEASEKPSA